jgi:hypothetical protein
MRAERIPARREIKAELAQLQRATEEEIRARAYEIYLERRDAPGDAMSDWLQAEAELQPEIALAAIA